MDKSQSNSYADDWFQGDRSIATYAKIGAPADPTIEYFVSHLTQSEYFTDVEEIPNRTHGTIPWMVKKELGDNVS